MPLLPGKSNIGHNIETEQSAGKPHKQAVAIALNVARKHHADGGVTAARARKIAHEVVGMHVEHPAPKGHKGLEKVMNRVHRESGGLNLFHVPRMYPDRFKMRPPKAARYVKRHGTTSTHTGPIHSSVAGRTDHLPMHVPSGSYVLPADIVSGAPGAEGNTMAGFAHARRVFGGNPYGGGSEPYNHKGGPYGMAHGGEATGVPIVAAGGEYVVHPDAVREIGGGDLDMGHKVLDEFVKRVRAELIKTLKKLPGPKKN